MLCRCDALFAAVFAVVLLSAPVVNAESDEALMKAGLEAPYTARDPKAAATQFRKVLEQHPNHYGATFELAMALDRGGKSAEALPLWGRSSRWPRAIATRLPPVPPAPSSRPIARQ